MNLINRWVYKKSTNQNLWESQLKNTPLNTVSVVTQHNAIIILAKVILTSEICDNKFLGMNYDWKYATITLTIQCSFKMTNHLNLKGLTALMVTWIWYNPERSLNGYLIITCIWYYYQIDNWTETFFKSCTVLNNPHL